MTGTKKVQISEENGIVPRVTLSYGQGNEQTNQLIPPVEFYIHSSHLTNMSTYTSCTIMCLPMAVC